MGFAPFYCCCPVKEDPPPGNCLRHVWWTDSLGGRNFQHFDCCLYDAMNPVMTLTRAVRLLELPTVPVVESYQINGPGTFNLEVLRPPTVTSTPVVLRSSRLSFSTTARVERPTLRYPQTTVHFTAIVEVTIPFQGIPYILLIGHEPDDYSKVQGERIFGFGAGGWQPAIIDDGRIGNWASPWLDYPNPNPPADVTVAVASDTEDFSCDTIDRNYDFTVTRRSGGNVRRIDRRASNVAFTFGPNPCCKRPGRGDCIVGGGSKSPTGHCCPLTQFDTVRSVISTLNLNTGCLNILGDEDGHYEPYLITPIGTHDLSSVTPPAGLTLRWEKTITNALRWQDYNSTNGSCTSSTGNRVGDIIIRLSLVANTATYEVITDIPSSGPLAGFKDLLFKRSFTVASDCSDFGGTIQNAFGSTDAGVGVTTDRTAGADEQDLDGETDFIMGWGGSTTLSIG